jgi:hypothetical protein
VEEACRRSKLCAEGPGRPGKPLLLSTEQPPIVVHSSNLAAWRPSHTLCTSHPRQRNYCNRSARWCCNLPGGDFPHLPNFDIELWRCGGVYIKAGWLAQLFTGFFRVLGFPDPPGPSLSRPISALIFLQPFSVCSVHVSLAGPAGEIASKRGPKSRSRRSPPLSWF